MERQRSNLRAQHESVSILDKVIGNIFKRKSVPSGEILMENKAFYQRVANRASVVVLSECLDKISILCIITQVKIDPEWMEPVVYRSLQEKMSAKDDGYDIFAYTNKKKLAKELSFVSKLLNDAIDDILYSGDVSRLLDSLEVYRQEVFDGRELLDNAAKNKVLLRKLSYDMRKSGTRNRETLNKKADQAYEMHEKYEETLGYGNAEYKYVDKWENSRTYLSNFLNKQAETNYENTISTYNQKQDLENRINKEITDYMEVCMHDLQTQIEHWMTKYDEDVDRLEKVMFELKVAKEKMELDFASLTTSYAERQTEIEKWVELREQLRQEAEIEKKREDAALRIQAWWRGVMVRKHLGPYRKKKGKKDKGKGKKGGKKGGKKKK